ncbi:MAG TPA: DUF3040 domain-containing protein [Candidatus Limnocylindria bacterium]|nr:DUF3040 domain-containing protein [Candidatus Limnocylindria bacterium]
MPLSEHEQRLLEQMERALYAEDPKLASTLRGADVQAHQRRRLLVGSLGLMLGLGLLLAGVSVGWPLGVLGFLVMLVSAWWVLSGWRGGSTSSAAASTGRPTGKRTPKPAKSSGMMDRFEDRWRRRREGDGK